MNDAIKKPGTIEKISEEEMQFRVSEIQRCMSDPIYFCSNYYYIRSIDKGTIIIPLYKKQEELINAIYEGRFTISLAARQSGKTTAYVGIVLHTCFFNEGKEIVIVANKEKTAIGILKRIKHAYEWIPEEKSWIKPGVKKWSEKQIEFENGCSVTAMASSADAARSSSIYLLILDEAHYIPRNIVSDLWSSVFPVLSRSRTSKCVMVSTANGIGGLFYDIWQDATIGKNKEWNAVLIDWWDVPGRDEAWKQQQIKGFGPGGELKFEQEFGNRFLGSAPTLLDQDVLRYLADQAMEDNIVPTEWNIGNEKIGHHKVQIYKEPKPYNAYVLGGDVSEGIGCDYSIAKVFDITDPMNIEEVASFESNTISGATLAYVMSKMAAKYNQAYVACERNGVSIACIDTLWNVFEYENIVDIGSNKYAVGIFSNHQVKLDACLWFRDLTREPDFEIKLHDSQTIFEFQRFEKLKSKSVTRYEATTGHDDKAISVIWAMFCLKPEILERYYNVTSRRINKFGAEVPARVHSEMNGILTHDVTEDEMATMIAKQNNFVETKSKLLGDRTSEGDADIEDQQDSADLDFVFSNNNVSQEDDW